MCNALDEIWVEREGRLEPTDLAFTDDSHYRQVIDKIVAAVGRRVDESSPMVDARLPDGIPRQRHRPAPRHPRRGADDPEVRRATRTRSRTSSTSAPVPSTSPS